MKTKYLLMHKAVPVLRMELDEATGAISSIDDVLSLAHVPIGVVKSGVASHRDLTVWWTDRSIPAFRYGLGEALEALKVSSPLALLAKSYGLSLSDQYWAKPESSCLSWDSINFFDNTFSEYIGDVLFGKKPDVLFGKKPESKELCLISPDITTDGWLQKRWAIVNGKRSLLKGGSGLTMQEPCNELLATEIMKRLGIPHIPYALTFIGERPFSVCEDFITRDTELVSAWRINQTLKRRNEVSFYQHFLDCCEALGIPNVRENLDKMIALDYLIVNQDRHYGNFGAIRNADTLEWLGLAPVFDSGTSLWHDTPTSLVHRAKVHSVPFKTSHEDQVKLIGSFDWLDFSMLNDIDEVFRDILGGSPFIDSARRYALCRALARRVVMLQEYADRRDGSD